MAKQLTAAFVRTVNTPGKYNDEHGLLFRVVRSKKKQLISKSWVQRIVIHGRPRELGLGGYPQVSLADARQRALENRRIARAGGDPRAQRSTAKTGRATPAHMKKPGPASGGDAARVADTAGDKPK